jgi:hypothetical protein
LTAVAQSRNTPRRRFSSCFHVLNARPAASIAESSWGFEQSGASAKIDPVAELITPKVFSPTTGWPSIVIVKFVV